MQEPKEKVNGMEPDTLYFDPDTFDFLNYPFDDETVEVQTEKVVTEARETSISAEEFRMKAEEVKLKVEELADEKLDVVPAEPPHPAAVPTTTPTVVFDNAKELPTEEAHFDCPADKEEVKETVKTVCTDMVDRAIEIKTEATEIRASGEPEIADAMDGSAKAVLDIAEAGAEKIMEQVSEPAYEQRHSVGQTIREILIGMERAKLVIEQELRSIPERFRDIKSEAKEESEKIGTITSVREEAAARVSAWNDYKDSAGKDQKELTGEKWFDTDIQKDSMNLMHNIERAYKQANRSNGSYNAVVLNSVSKSFNESVDTLANIKKQIAKEIDRREALRSKGTLVNGKSIADLKQLSYRLSGIEVQLKYDTKRWNLTYKGTER